MKIGLIDVGGHRWPNLCLMKLSAYHKNGIATLELASSDYYLKEQKAPEGFKVKTARILFTIKADGKTVAENTNEKDTGEPTPAPEQPTTPPAPTNHAAPASILMLSVPHRLMNAWGKSKDFLFPCGTKQNPTRLKSSFTRRFRHF